MTITPEEKDAAQDRHAARIRFIGAQLMAARAVAERAYEEANYSATLQHELACATAEGDMAQNRIMSLRQYLADIGETT